MSGWTYDSGQFNLYCDVCKKKIKANEAKHRWDGLIVCPDDWEMRQPQDFIKAKIDKISVPFSRPTEDIEWSTQYGMFDTITTKEIFSIFSDIFTSITDAVTYIESVLVTRETPLFDPVGFSDAFARTWTTTSALSDTVTYVGLGYLAMYDYTTPAPPDASAYFATDDYVGLLRTF
jgi:hypothetical protein